MSIDNLAIVSQMVVGGIPVFVERKPIKDLRLTVYPTDSLVRVSAPLYLTDDRIRSFVADRVSWIREKQGKFAAQPHQPEREMVSGETHYFFGRQYSLDVVERCGRHEIAIINNSTLRLFVNPATSTEKRLLVLNEWYRHQLKQRVPELLSKWELIIGERVSYWGIKKMKTKWGSCNIQDRRIWLNLELAKKPVECLEYVLVHELVHLLERYHNDCFYTYMDRYLPQWQRCRDLLNSEP